MPSVGNLSATGASRIDTPRAGDGRRCGVRVSRARSRLVHGQTELDECIVRKVLCSAEMQTSLSCVRAAVLWMASRSRFQV
jgi:hypothetical protein